MTGLHRRGYQHAPPILRNGLPGSLLETSIRDANITFGTEFALDWSKYPLARRA